MRRRSANAIVLAEALPDAPAILVGWSLGGMLALQLAESHPGRVAGLALVSTTPCFGTRPDWPHGCSEATFRAFADGVGGNSTKLLGRFFALMLQGDGLARSRFNALAREAVDRRHPPSAAGLAAGLELLTDLDLRPLLPGIAQPAWVAHGDGDAVVPAAAGLELAGRLPLAAWHGFTQAGHAPFLTQPAAFEHGLEAWCRNISSPNA